MDTHTPGRVQIQQERAFQRDAIPERSLIQRMDALEEANKIRSKRARLKKDMKGGRKSIYDLLRNPPDYIETMKLFDLMLAQPKFGRVKVNKVLTHCRISPSKTVGGLSDRQRNEILVQLKL